MENRYSVIFKGQLNQEPISAEAMQKIQRLLGVDSADILAKAKLGNPLVIKAALPRDDAEALARLLSRHGLPCKALAPGEEVGQTRVMFTGKMAPGPLQLVTREKLVTLLGPTRSSVLAHIHERKPILIAQGMATTQAILLARLLTHNGLPCEVYAGAGGIAWKPVPPEEMTQVPAYASRRRRLKPGGSLSDWISPLFLLLVPAGLVVSLFIDEPAGPLLGKLIGGLGVGMFLFLRLRRGGASGFFAGAMGITAVFGCISCADDDGFDVLSSNNSNDTPILPDWPSANVPPASPKPDHFVHQYQLIFTGRTPGYVSSPSDLEKLGFLLGPMGYDLEAVLAGAELFVLKDGQTPAMAYSLRQHLENLGVNCEMVPKD